MASRSRTIGVCLMLAGALASVRADAAKIAIANCTNQKLTFCFYDSSDFTKGIFTSGSPTVGAGATVVSKCTTSSSCNVGPVANTSVNACGSVDGPQVLRTLGNYSYQYRSDGSFRQMGNSPHTFDAYVNACGELIGAKCTADSQCIQNHCLQGICIPERAASTTPMCSNPVPGEITLYNSQAWTSCERNYVLLMNDGTLQLINNSNGVIWAVGDGRGYRTIFQGDGNLVVYDAQGKSVWASNTVGPSRKLLVQGDGNVVIYGPNGPVWATNTVGK